MSYLEKYIFLNTSFKKNLTFTGITYVYVPFGGGMCHWGGGGMRPKNTNLKKFRGRDRGGFMRMSSVLKYISLLR
jgi:hypothetical protein